MASFGVDLMKGMMEYFQLKKQANDEQKQELKSVYEMMMQANRDKDAHLLNEAQLKQAEIANKMNLQTYNYNEQANPLRLKETQQIVDTGALNLDTARQTQGATIKTANLQPEVTKSEISYRGAGTANLQAATAAQQYETEYARRTEDMRTRGLKAGVSTQEKEFERLNAAPAPGVGQPIDVPGVPGVKLVPITDQNGNTSVQPIDNRGQKFGKVIWNWDPKTQTNVGVIVDDNGYQIGTVNAQPQQPRAGQTDAVTNAFTVEMNGLIADTKLMRENPVAAREKFNQIVQKYPNVDAQAMMRYAEAFSGQLAQEEQNKQAAYGAWEKYKLHYGIDNKGKRIMLPDPKNKYKEISMPTWNELTPAQQHAEWENWKKLNLGAAQYFPKPQKATGKIATMGDDYSIAAADAQEKGYTYGEFKSHYKLSDAEASKYWYGTIKFKGTPTSGL